MYTFDLHHQEDMMEGNVMTEYEEKFSLWAILSVSLLCVRNSKPAEFTETPYVPVYNNTHII